MRQITRNELRNLSANPQPPCISLYQPTHRQSPDKTQDPIRFKNLLGQVEEQLRSQYPQADAKKILRPLRELQDDRDFWLHQLDGLAVLAAGGQIEVFQLQHATPELAVVGESFHIKPLLMATQTADRFHVLCVTREKAWLLEGNRYVLDEVDSPQIPTLTEALGEEVTEPHLTVASYSKGSGAPHAPHGEPSSHHGHGGRKDEKEIDAERYFRAVDRFVLEHHSQPAGVPLVLAALPDAAAKFREVSHNPQLLSKGVDKDPGSMQADQLRQAAWKQVEPVFQQRISELKEKFGTAKARDAGSDDRQKVRQAAEQGRVATLFVAARDQSVQDQAAHDELDDVAEAVWQADGEVYVLPQDQMPSQQAVAAIYRY